MLPTHTLTGSLVIDGDDYEWELRHEPQWFTLTVGRVCRLPFVPQRQVVERRSFNFQCPKRPLNVPVATYIARKYIRQSWRLP